MLRTQDDQEIWFVTQPDHASVSGFLAAHWGNDQFRRPGTFASAADPDALAAEVIFAIAQHDNGWWEWEAEPTLSENDRLPVDLSELLADRQQGMKRWRNGIPRFAENHPYVSLLISWHAYWLYAPSLRAANDRGLWHPLFGNQETSPLGGTEMEQTRRFVNEIETIQNAMNSRLQADPATASWIEPQHLQPHVRLLQLLDALSLSLCSTMVPASHGVAVGRGRDAVDLHDVPRSGWQDRVSIELRPTADQRIEINPYPFDTDPLPVHVPTRIIRLDERDRRPFSIRWHTTPSLTVEYVFCGTRKTSR